MNEITGPGTIDQLVADATDTGHRVTVRLIRDWTEAGLLDYPQKRAAGKGHGSQQALYPATQRNLFLTLLHHRPSNGIRSLARIPVGIWMYWGDAYVPLRQVRRAMKTWIGNPRVSLRQAKETAREILRQLDNPRATATAQRELLDALTIHANTGTVDFERLEHAIRDVFEPGSRHIRRAVGHPAAPFTADAMLDLIKARLAATTRIAKDEITNDEYQRARHAHHLAYAEYAMQQPLLAPYGPQRNPGMYEPVTAEIALNSCCGHLLTAIGLAIMYPERAARIHAQPGIRVSFLSAQANGL